MIRNEKSRVNNRHGKEIVALGSEHFDVTSMSKWKISLSNHNGLLPDSLDTS